MRTVRSEGGLLPADLLTRVAALDASLGGLAPEDYHLAPGERLGEAIARSWARLTAAWELFVRERDLLGADEHAGALTRDRWLLPLFAELGYGRLVRGPAVELGERSYPVFAQWQNTPIHLVGAGVELDRRTKGVAGAAQQSPHSLVQELLNRSPERLWGLVTNGLVMRLLRDNVSLTRQAYVEFDVEGIFSTEGYADFALLWLCCHQSRVEAEQPEDCWLEQWMETAQREGMRALGELRDGVERAIEALGRGFLAHPANRELQVALRDGTLGGQDFYRELLRVVYRLLFLFVAEDRDVLLLPNDGTVERRRARERFASFYGTERLRRLAARRRGGRAHDLWEQIKLVAGWMFDAGQPLLALPALGSALWDPGTTSHVSAARLGNEAFLDAVRALSWIDEGRRTVDFRNLGAEEMGSIYESLLELHPIIDRQAAQFSLDSAVGHERKQTGSYYTPTGLIAALLDTALDPLIDRASRESDPERALLAITVCDPACGSGHFLIAAANRIAKRLAAVREQDPEPSPRAVRHALRDVISRCVFGVDVNPMAVELCKFALWMEALEPGRPLSFLDMQIRPGNALVGAVPGGVERGIPNSAFEVIRGDDFGCLEPEPKPYVTRLRQRNARELAGVMTLFDTDGDESQLAHHAADIAALPDDDLRGIAAKKSGYSRIRDSQAFRRLSAAADVWTAAALAEKRPATPAITHRAIAVRFLFGQDAVHVREYAWRVVPGCAR